MVTMLNDTTNLIAELIRSKAQPKHHEFAIVVQQQADLECHLF